VTLLPHAVAYNKIKVKFISKQGGTNNEENNVVCINGSVSAFLFHGGICCRKVGKNKSQ
jgi:hypothetical protein